MAAVLQQSSSQTFQVMKLSDGSEPSYFYSSTVNPSAHKVVDYNNDLEKCKIFKADGEVAREAKHEKASILESKSHEKDKVPLPTGQCDRDGLGNAQRRLSCIEAVNSISGMTNESNNISTSYSIPNTDGELLQNETAFYTDKAVRQVELSEQIISYKDINFNIVKDICIDEGVPSSDKIMVEKGQVDHKRIIDILYSDLVGESDLIKEAVDGCLPSSEDDKFVNASDKEVRKHGRTENFHRKGLSDVNATDDSVNDISENFLPENLLSINSAGPASDNLISFDLDRQLISGDKDKSITTDLAGHFISGEKEKRVTIKGNPKMSIEEGESIADAKAKLVNYTFDEHEHVMPKKSFLLQDQALAGRHFYSPEFTGIDQLQPDQGHVSNMMDDVYSRPVGASEDTKLVTFIAPSADEISLGCNNTKDLPFDRSVENGSITFDFNSLSSAMIARMEGAENADDQNSAQTYSGSGLEDGALNNLMGSTRSFFIQHGYGDSDFSGSLSDPIAYSGSIPFSGNISLQSESSTSTRSFAFPVLNSEWSGSPVKMEKADRRELKRHRGWRIPVFCCKF